MFKVFCTLLLATTAANAMVAPAFMTDAATCKATEYCCPDAKHCLTPTKKICGPSAKCAATETCCPLTKLCVTVGAACTSPCGATEYCCPDAKHCLTPDPAGALCTADAACKTGDVCCPLTHLCVKVGKACTPP